MKRGRRVDIDTWIWPMIQGGVLGIQEEEQALDKVLKAARDMEIAKAEGWAQNGVMVDLTSGYFGLYRKYKDAIIESQAPYKVIAASPEVSTEYGRPLTRTDWFLPLQANGFYKSKGVSHLIPEGYTLLESRFHRDVLRKGRDWNEATQTGIELTEWNRSGWTYHAKGTFSVIEAHTGADHGVPRRVVV
jgi:CDP-diacylglycerol--glycerol-3-phosphate 3-phosphatidyltransferase